MQFQGAFSTWRSFFATMLVVTLMLAPALQAHAAASHSDHAMAQIQLAQVDAQRFDCCPDIDGKEHARHAACGSCVLPCMTALHALTDSPLETSPFGAVSYHGLDGQVAGELSTAPDLKPPKTSS